MMSSTGEPNRTLLASAKRLWRLGGFRAYYRGLTVRYWLIALYWLGSHLEIWHYKIGLVGVFPYVSSHHPCVFINSLLSSYSAIDMSAFEALKLTYVKSTGKDEPGVLALLAFGSVSGSVGATSVYPLNLVRTRLQASGSPGHPQRYNGMMDVISTTYNRDGWRGFYRGLFPTLAKVRNTCLVH